MWDISWQEPWLSADPAALAVGSRLQTMALYHGICDTQAVREIRYMSHETA